MSDDVIARPVVIAALQLIGRRVLRDGQRCPHCGSRSFEIDDDGLCPRCAAEQADRLRESKRRWAARKRREEQEADAS